MTGDSPKARHRVPNVFDRSTLLEDAATFYVNNRIYEGWKSINTKRTLNSLANSFNLTILDRYTADSTPWELVPGKRGHLHLGKSAVFEGFIDNMDVSYSANSRNITLQGRSRTADLVDCAALGDSEYKSLNLSQIAEKLCAPFGLKVLTLTDIGAPFETISIRPDEKVFDVLNRLARQRGVLLYTSTHGNLIINKRAATRAATELVQGVNILSASASFDNTDRFSQYIIKTQNDGTVGSSAEDAIKGEGKASDSGITRYRPTVIVSETSGDSASAKQRAEWEATFRAAKGMAINVKVQGWREKNGQLWDINKLVYLNSPGLGVSDQFLINEVSYTQSESKARICELELVRKDAYENQSDVSASSDPIGGLGS